MECFEQDGTHDHLFLDLSTFRVFETKGSLPYLDFCIKCGKLGIGFKRI